MTKTFTHFLNGVVAKLVLLIAFVCIGANAGAETVDLGALELDKEYTVKDFNGYKATITPDRDGTLVWYTATNTFITVYNDAECTVETPNMHSFVSGGQIREYEVKAGTTYYCNDGFLMNGGTFKIYFAGGLERVKIVPEEKSVVDITAEGYIELNYNMAVSIDTVLMYVNDEVIDGGRPFIVGRIVGIQLKGENEDEIDLKGLVEKGVLKGGEELVLKFTVTSVLDPTQTLEETLTYICPVQPMVLVSDNSDGFVLKSYWTPGDDAGKLILTFDDSLWIPTAEIPGPTVVINYGNAESEDPGDFYYEEFAPTVDGNKLICDFTQKRRRVEDMITTGIDYGSALIKVVNVLDKDGNLASSPGKGTLGTWSWRFDHEQVDCDLFYEFTSSTGSVIYQDTKEIELWISGLGDSEFSPEGGVMYSWTDADGKADSVVVAASALNLEVDGEDVTFSVPVPSEVCAQKLFTVKLVGVDYADGVKHTVEGEFSVEQTTTGIGGVTVADDILSEECYDFNGKLVAAPVKGLNVIKRTLIDGTVVTIKILVK